VGGEGGRALSEDDAELAAVSPEEADKHGSSPRPEQLAVAGGGGDGGRGRIGVVGGWGRPVELQASYERVHFRAGAAVLPRHGRDRRELVKMAKGFWFAQWRSICAVQSQPTGRYYMLWEPCLETGGGRNTKIILVFIFFLKKL
jgi:hypothetical protein